MGPEWILIATGIYLLIFRSRVARWQREFQNRAYGFRFGEDKQGPMELLVLLVGIGFVAIGAALLQQAPPGAESPSRFEADAPRYEP